MAVSPETRAAIQERFPSYSYLLDVPEVGELLERAMNEGWPEGRFISSLYATQWYRSRTEAGRQDETLSQLDPTEYTRQVQDTYATVQDMSGKLGITFTHGEMTWITAVIRSMGRDINEPEARIGILNWIRANPDRINTHGSIYAAQARVDQIARQEFFFAPSLYDLQQTAINIGMGYGTEEGYREALGEWFGASMPHIASQLKGGKTLADVVNPYRDIIAKELELGGLDEIDMVGTTQWKWLTGKPDPTTGEVRLPTQQEVIEAARRDGRWQRTLGGRQQATGLAAGITEAMGVRA